MLKVVGASWFQTRVSTCIVGAVFALGLLAVILGEIDQEEDDGIYSATVFWHEEAGFHIDFWGQGNELDEIPYGVGRAYYKQEIDTTGWAVFEAETRPEYPDWVQAYAAGLLEGSLTWQLIYWHWLNTVEDVCSDREEFCDLVHDFIEENSDWLKDIAEERGDKDPFWHHVHLFYVQLDGLETGWRHGVKRSLQDIDIPHHDFLWMNVISDLADMERYYNNSLEDVELPFMFSTAASFASAFVNFQSDTGELYAAHNSGGLYQSMLRMLKRYQFGYHFTSSPESSLVPGQTVSFSSYPGVIHSQDDFYLITGDPEFGKRQHQLAVLGTALHIQNRPSLNKLKPEEQVLIGPRVMAANRIAQDGRFWGRYLARGNSGTGSKQWLIVDYGQIAGTERKPSKNATTSENTTNNSISIEDISSKPMSAETSTTKPMSVEITTPNPTSSKTSSEATTSGPTSSDTSTSKPTSSESTTNKYTSTTSQINVIPSLKKSAVSIKERKGLLWVVEQLPGYMHSADQTLALVRKGSWVSTGEPSYQNKTSTNSRSASQENRSQFSHSQHNINDIENLTSVMELMRNNSFHRRSHSVSKAKAVSSPSQLPVPMGTIDSKVFLASPYHNVELFVVSGPLNSYIDDKHNITQTENKTNIIPFQWSKSRFANETHMGLPDVLDFDVLQPQWAWF